MQQTPAHLMTSGQLVAAIGEALYGVEWRRPLARSLGLSGAQMARLGTGAPVTSQTLRRLRDWARDEVALEAGRVARRIELLSTAAAVIVEEDH